MQPSFIQRMVLVIMVCSLFSSSKPAWGLSPEDLKPRPGESVATFAGGCFWCTEADFEKLPGVTRVYSGYCGGKEPNPTYEQNSSGKTGHLESVQVFFDPAKVTYRQLVEYFWRHIDPTDAGGQFVDRGRQYASAIFYHDEEQRRAAQESKARLEASGVLKGKPVVTEIRPYEVFWLAEDYHQDYAKKNPLRYQYYRFGSGRDQYLREVFGKDTGLPGQGDASEKGASPQGAQAAGPAGVQTAGQAGGAAFVKPGKDELKKRLTPIQYEVTQKNGTEPPFKNAYWDNHEQGIYVDIVSGEPLFSSKDKYESGTGWPSFVRPLEPGNLVERRDRSLFVDRTEVRSRLGDSHLGHVFKDGPPPDRLRYCMNSAAMRFIPRDQLEKEGYGQYLPMFQ